MMSPDELAKLTKRLDLDAEIANRQRREAEYQTARLEREFWLAQHDDKEHQ